ncbi:hypothetical protein C0993_000593 [Termitomyces sp. T159_Od127]|nr:hypothetical protein C0993_000593 [Termitomyces sp. T159_Od127]
MAMSTNCVTSSLIVSRIWNVRRGSSRYRSFVVSQQDPLSRAIRITIEAGLIYSISLVALLIVYLTHHNSQFGVQRILIQIIAITFNLIIVHSERGSDSSRDSASFYDREREEREEKARKEAEALRKATEIGPKVTPALVSSSSAKPANGNPAKNAAFPRLGFGAIPGAGAAAAVAAPKASAPATDDSPTTARERFGNQKAISSDMFFERNAYDPNAVSEAQTRLQSFRGATSISSNQYFGREEEEDQLVGQPVLQDGSLANLEMAARDVVAKVLSNPDVQNFGESVRSGALKLSDYLAQMSER